MIINDYENINMYVVFNSEDYRCIEDFESGYAATYHKNGVCGYIDTNGYEHLLYDCIKVGDFCNFVAPICKLKNGNELWGFINTNFEEITPFKYLYVERCVNFFIVKSIDSNNYIVIDGYGKTVYENLDREDCLKYIDNNKQFFLNKSSQVKKCTHTIPFTNISKYSYESIDGEKVIPYENTENRDYSCGYVILRVDSCNYKIFDEKGKQLKIHTCIKINAETMYLKNIIEKFDLKITSKVFDGYSSLIRYGEYEYIIFGKDMNELMQNKQELFEYIEEEKVKEKVKK